MAHVGAFAGGVDEQGVPHAFRQLVLRRSLYGCLANCKHTDTLRCKSDYKCTHHILVYHVISDSIN